MEQGTTERSRWLQGWWPGLLVALVVVGLQLVWVAMDSPRLLSDDRPLFRSAACVAGSASTSAEMAECLAASPYPPVIPLLGALHISLGEPTPQLAVMSLWPFWLLLTLGAYGWVRPQAGRLAACAAASLACTLACLTNLRGFFFAELPMAAIVVAALAAWTASDGLRRAWPTAALGGLLALGLLSKWSFGFFMGPAMLLALLTVLFRLGRRWYYGAPAAALVTVGVVALVLALGGWMRLGVPMGAGLLGLAGLYLGLLAWRWPGLLAPEARRRIVGVAILTLACAALAGPWYLANQGPMQDFLSSNLARQYDGDAMGLSETWFFYPVVAWFRIPTLLLPLLLIGLVRTLLVRDRSFGGWAWAPLLCGMVVLAISPYRSDRYLAPALPVLAIPALLALRGWPRALRALSIALLLWGGTYQLGWLFDRGETSLVHRLAARVQRPAPFGFAGNDRHIVREGLELFLASPFTFQLVGHSPRPMREPWIDAVRELHRVMPAGCPALVALHCEQHCDREELQDMLYAWSPRAPHRVEHAEGPPSKDGISALIQRVAPTAAQRGAWPANLFVLGYALPGRASAVEPLALELGLALLPLPPDPQALPVLRLLHAASPAAPQGCGG